METMEDRDAESLRALPYIAQALIDYPDPEMIEFFLRCAREDAERDLQGEERRDQALLEFGRVLTELTPFTDDAVRVATETLCGFHPEGMSDDEADGVERAAEEFATHRRAAYAAACTAGFEAGFPYFVTEPCEIDMMQDFLLDGRTVLTLHVYLDLVVPDVIVSVEHTDTGEFEYPDDVQHYAAMFMTACAAAA